MSTKKMHKLLLQSPKKYPIMLLNPKLNPENVAGIRERHHLITVNFKGEARKGMVPNIYKINPQTVIEDFDKKVKTTKDKWSLSEPRIFDTVVEVDDEMLLMLYSKHTPKRIRNDLKPIYMTDMIRHKGRFRSGVVCVYPIQTSKFKLEKNQAKIFGYIQGG